MLKIIILSIGIFVGSLFAQDNLSKISSSTFKEYSTTLSTKIEKNKEEKSLLLIFISKKGVIESGMHVNLTLFMPNNEVIEYKNIKNVNKHYLLNVDFSKKGKYGYVLKFSKQNGEFVHYLRGSFKI